VVDDNEAACAKKGRKKKPKTIEDHNKDEGQGIKDWEFNIPKPLNKLT